MNQQLPIGPFDRRKAIEQLLNSGKSSRHLDLDVGSVNVKEIVAAATLSSSLVQEPAPSHVVAAMLYEAVGADPLVGSAPKPVNSPEPFVGGASAKTSISESHAVCHAATIKVRKTRKKPSEEDPLPLEKLPYLSFKDTYRRYKVHTQKALYHLASQTQSYLRYPKAGLPSNGFNECLIDHGLGKKKLIIAAKYEQWLERK